MNFTTKQAIFALGQMKVFFELPSSQERLDEFQNAAQGNDFEYRTALVKLLSDDVYPGIFRRLDVPEDSAGPKFFMEAMGGRVNDGGIVSKDLEVSELWFRVEGLMRNQTAMHQAYQTMMQQRRAC